MQPEPTPDVDDPRPPVDPPRKLLRSRADRVLAGVCGGLGRYLGIDPVIVRVAAVVLAFVGGAGAIAYLAMVLLVPDAAPGAEEAEPAPSRRGMSGAAIAGIVIALIFLGPPLLGGGLLLAGLLVPLALMAMIGLGTWWLVSGDPVTGEPGTLLKRGLLGIGVLAGCGLLFVLGFWTAGLAGGIVAGSAVIATGVVLVVGAFTGHLRWLALPATALALGAAVVAAAGIKLDGGVGERDYSPGSAVAIKDRYELGAGRMIVDLRRAGLSDGDTRLKLQMGMGQTVLVVPKDVCVSTSAKVGAGAVDVFGRTNGGADLDWDDSQAASRARPRLVVDADVGFGELLVRHDRRDVDQTRSDRGFRSYRGAGDTGCRGA